MMRLIVGLGNIGKKYYKTRHNIGFLIVDTYVNEVRRQDFSKKPSLHCELSKFHINDNKIIFIKPTTYMNASGEAVRRVLDYYQLTSDQMLVVHDDTALPFGTIRTRSKGSSAGHNGIKSIINSCGENFWRLRIGVGSVPKHYSKSDYVLARFKKEEKKHIPSLITHSNELIDAFINHSLEPQSIEIEI